MLDSSRRRAACAVTMCVCAALPLGGCAVVTVAGAAVGVASTAVGVGVSAVGLAADAAIGTVRLGGKAVGAVMPGGDDAP